MLEAYFDDSGTHDGSPVVAIGGLLGTETQWEAFNAAWQRLLDHPLPDKPKLTQFHLAHCRWGDGKFQNYRPPEREHVTYLFRQVIMDVGLVSFATGIDMKAWDELVFGEVAAELGPAIEGCFYKCVESLINHIRNRRPFEKVAITVDQGVHKHLHMLSSFFERSLREYPEIAGIGFAKVEDVLALQGADTIATETYWFAQAFMENPESPEARAHFRDFLKRDLSQGLFFDREKLEGVVARVKSVLP